MRQIRRITSPCKYTIGDFGETKIKMLYNVPIQDIKTVARKNIWEGG